MTDQPTPERLWSGYRAWAAEGARVAIVTCLRCGAAVFIDPSEDAMTLHERWHQEGER